MRVLIALVFLAAPLSTSRAAEEPTKPSPLVGYWLGMLKLGAEPVRLAFAVKETDGKLTATLDSPDQGATGLPFPEAELKDGKVRIASKVLGVAYTGKLSDDGKAIAGEWTQGGRSMPLAMSRTDKMPSLVRPQTPKPPFPYAAEDVKFENATAKVTLAGTLTMPKGTGPFPAVVLVTGSGPQDRDETLFGHKPFLVLADHLTRQGIAVLRYDDRGVGKSTGKFKGATTQDFATDAAAAVAYLHARKEIDPKRVGVAGHSEGGVVAPIVAADHPEQVGFIVLMSGTGLPGHVVLDRQRADVMGASGASAETVGLYKQLYATLNPILIGPGTPQERRAKVVAAAKAEVAKFTDAQRKELGFDKPEVCDEFGKLPTDPWTDAFFRYDPATALKRVKCPVLALNGTLDLQVSAEANLPAIEAALKAGHNPPAKFVALKGLNHLFQPAKTGGIEEYGSIEITFDEAALKLIADWVLERK